MLTVSQGVHFSTRAACNRLLMKWPAFNQLLSARKSSRPGLGAQWLVWPSLRLVALEQRTTHTVPSFHGKPQVVLRRDGATPVLGYLPSLASHIGARFPLGLSREEKTIEEMTRSGPSVPLSTQPSMSFLVLLFFLPLFSLGKEAQCVTLDTRISRASQGSVVATGRLSS